MKFRPHCGSLYESLEHMVELPDRAALVDHLRRDLRAWGYKLVDADVQVIPYGLDHRIGWTTHLVTLRNKEVSPGVWFFGSAKPDYFGAIGFTDGPA